MSMERTGLVYVAGHSGLVGQALVRQLREAGFRNILTIPSDRLDLTDAEEVRYFFARHSPRYVFLAAAKVGGIVANDKYSAEFIHKNLAIQQNVITNAFVYGTERLLFFGSACAYPKYAPVPIRESSLLCGELEPTNRAYAVAKIAGIEMCSAFRKQYGQFFVSLMPTNLYGVGDHYDLQNSHVIPGMIRRIYSAKINQEPMATLWGSGSPTREFLYADDLARAAIARLDVREGPDLLNVGSGEEISLRDLATTIADVIDYKGALYFDATKPDGTPRRALDSSVIRQLTNWKPVTEFRAGLKAAFEDFRNRYDAVTRL